MSLVIGGRGGGWHGDGMGWHGLWGERMVGGKEREKKGDGR